jgi:ribosomal protein S26
MGSPKQIDRTKRDSDVVEHVVKGLRTEYIGAHTRVTDLGVRPWFAGVVLSAVQVQVVRVRTKNGR